ncbi:hypothetical protein [Noviherbaspirillum denitrificans]|uniref:Uncharacterized protein n=1 Tax=Noviherbaspirillum denitrificans TaxID=1968433 RepID=A0A254TGN5_9BURK|nr:hypothetical protein [Noviherbaspirillum denitrificans]OWW21821.1 hypothetical protein AYR66_22320 [Noviherbaspirillum denitrificans]
MKFEFYKPEKTVTGPAYSGTFKVLATILTVILAGYGTHIALRFPLMQYSFGVKALLLGAALMLGVSYYWFLRSTITIDDKGITQTWMYNRKVEWHDIRSAKMIGIPYLGWIFPPRLIVRTGTAYATFNGGAKEVLVEFAKISLAYQMKK